MLLTQTQDFPVTTQTADFAKYSHLKKRAFEAPAKQTREEKRRKTNNGAAVPAVDKKKDYTGHFKIKKKGPSANSEPLFLSFDCTPRGLTKFMQLKCPFNKDKRTPPHSEHMMDWQLPDKQTSHLSYLYSTSSSSGSGSPTQTEAHNPLSPAYHIAPPAASLSPVHGPASPVHAPAHAPEFYHGESTRTYTLPRLQEQRQLQQHHQQPSYIPYKKQELDELNPLAIPIVKRMKSSDDCSRMATVLPGFSEILTGSRTSLKFDSVGPCPYRFPSSRNAGDV